MITETSRGRTPAKRSSDYLDTLAEQRRKEGEAVPVQRASAPRERAEKRGRVGPIRMGRREQDRKRTGSTLGHY